MGVIARALFLLFGIVLIGRLLRLRFPHSQDSKRIVGGKDASAETYHHLAHLFEACTGTVIGPRHILTAAHCFDAFIYKKGSTKPLSRFSVRVGEKSLVSPTTKELFATRVYIHKQYEAGKPLHDVAVVELDVFSLDVSRISPIESAPNEGTEVLAAGYGVLKFQGALPEVVQEVVLSVGKEEICAKHYKKDSGVELNNDMNICAHAKDIAEGKKDSCRMFRTILQFALQIFFLALI